MDGTRQLLITSAEVNILTTLMLALDASKWSVSHYKLPLPLRKAPHVSLNMKMSGSQRLPGSAGEKKNSKAPTWN
jgi:hypothetical protein